MRDYFADLGLEPDASLEDVRKAYKKLARLFHPDVAPERAEEFARIQEAYEQLRSYTKIEKVRDKVSSAKNSATGISKYLKNAYGRALEKAKDLSPQVRIEKLDQRIVAVIDKERRPGESQEVSWSVEEVCGKCRGKGGATRSKKAQCGNCKGLGYQLIERGASFRWKKTCERCHGQGFEVEEACAECQGYGKIAKLHKKKFVIPKNIDELDMYDDLGHYSFDGKTRGRLIIQWTKKI